MNNEQKTAEEVFRDTFKPDFSSQQNWNNNFKHFNTFEMIEFAHEYASQQTAALREENKNLKVDIESYKLTIDLEREEARRANEQLNELNQKHTKLIQEYEELYKAIKTVKIG